MLQLAHLLPQYNNPTSFKAGHTWGLHMSAQHAGQTHIGMHQDAACHWPPDAPPAALPMHACIT